MTVSYRDGGPTLVRVGHHAPLSDQDASVLFFADRLVPLKIRPDIRIVFAAG
jgi:hypothetical protein